MDVRVGPGHSPLSHVSRPLEVRIFQEGTSLLAVSCHLKQQFAALDQGC